MEIEIKVTIISAIVAIFVSVLGYFISHRHNIILQTRKLKETYYIAFIEAIHELAAHNDNRKALDNYVRARDKLLIIADEDVIVSLLKYEEEAVGKDPGTHDELLTMLLKAIRADLKLKNNKLKRLYLKK
jgi:hypothetical protein